MRGKLVGSFVVLAAVVVACGSSDAEDAGTAAGGQGGTGQAGSGQAGSTAGGAGGGSSGAAGAASFEQACDAFVQGYCATYLSCSQFGLKSLWGDEATCRARQKIACLAGANAPGVGFTPASLSACGQAIGTASCTELSPNNRPMACRVPGTLANGAACGDDWQCKSGYCGSASSGQCGACQDRASLGGACTSGLGCAGDSTCSGSVCIQRGAAGAPCSSTSPCSVTLTCFGGKCAKPAGPGQKCDTTGGTAPACDSLAGSYCVGGVCALASFSSPGQPCGPQGSTGYAVCSVGTCAGGVCAGFVPDGNACKSNSDCLTPARCLSGHCTLPDPGKCK